MIHRYRQQGHNIVLDTYSGSIHIVDQMTYEAIGLLDQGLDRDQVEDRLRPLFPDMARAEFESEFSETMEAIDDLIEKGRLFSQDIYAGIAADRLAKSKPAVKALCLNVAHTCNLTCDYCFAAQGKYHGKRAVMTEQVAKQAIDFLLENSGKHHNLDLDFFGGEPMMAMDVVKFTVDYARSKQDQYNKKFRFTFTTNGMLLDRASMDYLNQNMDNVVLSLDGRPEVHDRLRRTVDGQGSYKTIVPKFQDFARMRKDKEYYVRGTYTADNKDFLEDIRHIADLGFNMISLEPVIGNSGENYELKEEDLEGLYKQYEGLVDEMIDRRKQGRPITFYHYMLNLSGGPCIYKRIEGCGSGTEYLAVTPTGDLYPCHQFIGNEDFLMGNVYDGLQRQDLQEDFLACNVYSREDCQDCWAKLYCSGGCAANAFNSTGDLKGSYELGCKLFRKRMECAIALKVAEELDI